MYLRKLVRWFWVTKAAYTHRQRVAAYLRRGRIPWSPGYQESKFSLIRETLADPGLMRGFASDQRLPRGFGYGYDERVVEYPWTLARLTSDEAVLLDAGSVLNYRPILECEQLRAKKITIMTLGPENDAFWDMGISYQFGDLRDIPFRDGCFDQICCLSTLEHIGMDNVMYTGKQQHDEGFAADDAVDELLRVLRPGGTLLLSVPYGSREIVRWNGAAFAQQFDAALLDDLMRRFRDCESYDTSFYRYTAEGWNISNGDECREVKYCDTTSQLTVAPDLAAAARAVVLVEVTK